MKRLHFLLIVGFIVSFSFGSCNHKKKSDKTNIVTAVDNSSCKRKHVDWSRNAVMYEVNVRQYSKKGTFKAFEKHLPRLQELGVDILWFMPIHPISEKGRKGNLGSYYAVQDYLAVNKEFGTIRDFKTVVAKAHKQGMKVIIDWVANHTGRDHVWIKQHPDWFVYEKSGELVAPHDWFDVAKLDYKNQEMRTAMIDAMKFWVKECDIDGFRCSMAGDVPLDFWERASHELDSIKPMFMLAETYEPKLVQEAFDMLYGWDLQNVMNEIAKGNNNAENVSEWLTKKSELYCNDAYMLAFITNHDENTWHGTEFDRMKNGANAFAVLTYTLPGMPLIYTGQEVGMKKRFNFFDKDPIESWEANQYTTFYTKLNKLKHEHPALAAGLKGGKVSRIETTSDELVFAFSRTVGKDEVVTIINLSKDPINFDLTDNLPQGLFKEYFSHTNIDFTLTRTFDLKPWEYLVYIR